MLRTLLSLLTNNVTDDQKTRSFDLACKNNPRLVQEMRVGIALQDDIITKMLCDPFWVEVITECMENREHGIK